MRKSRAGEAAFVGRARLLAEIRQSLDSGIPVHLTGESGVGKTALTHRAAPRAFYVEHCVLVKELLVSLLLALYYNGLHDLYKRGVTAITCHQLQNGGILMLSLFDASAITAPALLQNFAQRSVAVVLTGDSRARRLRVTPSDDLTDEDRANIGRLKPQLIIELIESQPLHRWRESATKQNDAHDVTATPATSAIAPDVVTDLSPADARPAQPDIVAYVCNRSAAYWQRQRIQTQLARGLPQSDRAGLERLVSALNNNEPIEPVRRPMIQTDNEH